MTPFQGCPSNPGFLRRLFIGSALARRATELRFGRRIGENGPGPSDFWGAISWWWEEEHVLIPEQLEERRLALEMEVAFGNELTTLSNSNPCSEIFLSGIGIDMTTIRPPSSALSINARNGRPKGRWEWEGQRITIETESTPHPIRRFLISTLTGAKWKPTVSASLKRTNESSITPYGRLSWRWNSTQLSPTPTPSSSYASTITSPPSLPAICIS